MRKTNSTEDPHDDLGEHAASMKKGNPIGPGSLESDQPGLTQRESTPLASSPATDSSSAEDDQGQKPSETADYSTTLSPNNSAKTPPKLDEQLARLQQKVQELENLVNPSQEAQEESAQQKLRGLLLDLRMSLTSLEIEYRPPNLDALHNKQPWKTISEIRGKLNEIEKKILKKTIPSNKTRVEEKTAELPAENCHPLKLTESALKANEQAVRLRPKATEIIKKIARDQNDAKILFDRCIDELAIDNVALISEVIQENTFQSKLRNKERDQDAILKETWQRIAEMLMHKALHIAGKTRSGDFVFDATSNKQASETNTLSRAELCDEGNPLRRDTVLAAAHGTSLFTYRAAENIIITCTLEAFYEEFYRVFQQLYPGQKSKLIETLDEKFFAFKEKDLGAKMTRMGPENSANALFFEKEATLSSKPIGEKILLLLQAMLDPKKSDNRPEKKAFNQALYNLYQKNLTSLLLNNATEAQERLNTKEKIQALCILQAKALDMSMQCCRSERNATRFASTLTTQDNATRSENRQSTSNLSATTRIAEENAAQGNTTSASLEEARATLKLLPYQEPSTAQQYADAYARVTSYSGRQQVLNAFSAECASEITAVSTSTTPPPEPYLQRAGFELLSDFKDTLKQKIASLREASSVTATDTTDREYPANELTPIAQAQFELLYQKARELHVPLNLSRLNLSDVDFSKVELSKLSGIILDHAYLENAIFKFNPSASKKEACIDFPANVSCKGVQAENLSFKSNDTELISKTTNGLKTQLSASYEQKTQQQLGSGLFKTHAIRKAEHLASDKNNATEMLLLSIAHANRTLNKNKGSHHFFTTHSTTDEALREAITAPQSPAPHSHTSEP